MELNESIIDHLYYCFVLTEQKLFLGSQQKWRQFIFVEFAIWINWPCNIRPLCQLQNFLESKMTVLLFDIIRAFIKIVLYVIFVVYSAKSQSNRPYHSKYAVH